MDEDVDFSGWELPPLDDDPDQQPPPARPPYSGVSIGSDLVGLRLASGDPLDLGEYVCNDLVAVRPTVVGLAQLGSTDFHALSQQERVDALLVIERHRAWLDGLQQQLLAECPSATRARTSGSPRRSPARSGWRPSRRERG